LNKDSIQSVLKALHVMELFMVHPAWSITGISSELHYPTSTAHRLVATLEEAGYIYQDHQTKKYYLTIKPYLIGSKAEIVTLLEKRALAPIQKLAQALNESVNVSIAQGIHAITILKADAERQFSAVPHIGDKRQLHATSVGKCLLAYNSNGSYDQFMRSTEPLEVYTKNTITDKSAIIETLDQIRKTGYATDNEEVEEGLTCIGSPIRDKLDNCIAAMSVSIPTCRLEDREKIIAMIKATADEISSTFS
jgi:DNA-binding IclR family transcriptional regulator